MSSKGSNVEATNSCITIQRSTKHTELFHKSNSILWFFPQSELWLIVVAGAWVQGRREGGEKGAIATAAAFKYSGSRLIYSLSSFQILVFPPQLGDLPPELDALHHLAAVPLVPVHPDLCAVGDAAVRRRLQLPGRDPALKLQHIRHRTAHSLSGN